MRSISNSLRRNGWSDESARRTDEAPRAPVGEGSGPELAAGSGGRADRRGDVGRNVGSWHAPENDAPPPPAPHRRARPVVSALRSALREPRAAVGPPPAGPASLPRYRSAAPREGRRPSRPGPRGRVAGLPDPSGVPGMVGRPNRSAVDGVLRAGGTDRSGLARPHGKLVAPVGARGTTAMTRSGTVPRMLQVALASPGGRCYRHCKGPIRTRRLRSPLPGLWQVRACPSGVVSVTTYTEWTRRDPTGVVRRTLRRWTAPPSLVRSRDLRLATRHGPELGRAAERLLAATRPSRGVRVVYWRVYPFRGRDGSERRLFVCFRRVHRSPVFFARAPTAKSWDCPGCARKGSRSSASRRARRSDRSLK